MSVDAINWHTFFFLLFALITCVFAVAVVVASNIVRMAFYLIMSLGATAGVFFLAGADFVAAMQLLIYVGGTLVLLIFGVMLTAQGPFISMKTGGGEWILAAIVGGSLLAVLLQAAFSIEDWRSDERLAHAVGVINDARGQPAVVIRAKHAGPQYAGVRIRFEEKTRQTASFNAQEHELTLLSEPGQTTAGRIVQEINSDHETAEVFEAALMPGVAAETQIETRHAAKTTFTGPSAPHTATAIGLGLLGHRVDQLDQKDATLRRGMSGYLLPFEIVSVHLLVVLIGAAYLARTKRRAVAKHIG
jgi:NADH:ubiquinone oxidoreductase subunit 6 (subunit J)